MTLKNKIIQHLSRRGDYDPNVDEEVIDDLVRNIELAKKAFEYIEENGVMITRTNGIGFTIEIMNPMISGYQMFQRNIHQISAKLGISRKDRLLLKIVEQKKDSEFQELSKI